MPNTRKNRPAALSLNPTRAELLASPGRKLHDDVVAEVWPEWNLDYHPGIRNVSFDEVSESFLSIGGDRFEIE